MACPTRAFLGLTNAPGGPAGRLASIRCGAEAGSCLAIAIEESSSRPLRGRTGSIKNAVGVHDAARSAIPERVQVDRHARKPDRRDAAAPVDRLLVRPVRLSLPARQCPFVGMNAPDFQITASLVDGEFGVNVVVAGRSRPDLDDER